MSVLFLKWSRTPGYYTVGNVLESDQEIREKKFKRVLARIFSVPKKPKYTTEKRSGKF